MLNCITIGSSFIVKNILRVRLVIQLQAYSDLKSGLNSGLLLYFIKSGDRKFILYLETFRGKYDQIIHCKIKGRLNISNKNQENVESSERRQVLLKIYM